MDLTALRVERVRLAYDAASRVIALKGRRHLAVLAFALTLTGTSLAAGLVGQLTMEHAFEGAAVPLLVAGSQVRALDRLSRLQAQEGTTAVGRIDTLMKEGGETDVDDSEEADP